MKVCFIIGSPDISGGTYVIFQHALHLKLKKGCHVDIVPMFPATPENLAWHPDAASNLNFISFEEAANHLYDVAILTWWKTTLEAYRVNAGHYIYFVQSIESWFYPKEEGPLRKLVDATYTHNLPVITEANWIKDHLYTNYTVTSWLVLNGVRKDIYKPYGDKFEKKSDGHFRVLLEGPVNVDFKNVPKTVALCRRSKADEVWLLTSSDVSAFEGVDRVFSRVPIHETAKIYRSCDVIVKLSYVEGMFGPPLEMFHCGGTAIVYNVTGHDEYIQHQINGLVVRKDDDEKVVDYLNMLKSNNQKLQELKYEALKTAFDWPDWNTCSAHFYTAVKEIVQQMQPPDKVNLFAGIQNSFQQYVQEEEVRKKTLV